MGTLLAVMKKVLGKMVVRSTMQIPGDANRRADAVSGDWDVLQLSTSADAMISVYQIVTRLLTQLVPTLVLASRTGNERSVQVLPGNIVAL